MAKEGIFTHALNMLSSKDMLLRRQTCRLFACALQHSASPADWVPSANRTAIVDTLRTADPETAAFAATLMQQLAKRVARPQLRLRDAFAC